MTDRNYFGVVHPTTKERLQYYVPVDGSELFQTQYEEIYSDLIFNQIESLDTKQIL